MKALSNPSLPLFILAAVILAGAIMLFGPGPARANVSARYGVSNSPVGTYRASLPAGARPVFIGNERLYLYGGVYYKPVMLQGRVAYLAVDTTWQRQ